MARTRTPCFAASATSSRGVSVPSEAVVCEWRSTAASLFPVGQIGQNRTHGHAGRALRPERRVLVDERRPCDVEVRPRDVAGELAEEEAGRDRATIAAAGVVEIGDVAPELLLVFVDE